VKRCHLGDMIGTSKAGKESPKGHIRALVCGGSGLQRLKCAAFLAQILINA